MLLNKFLKGDGRTVKAKKNILASFLLKGLDGLIYLLLVPVTLGYLNEYEYGIWLTLNSVLMWINSFDIGLGNGLRNMLAISAAKDNWSEGKAYVSTTFIMLSVLMGGFIAIGGLLEPFINWYDILGTSPAKVPHLGQIVYVSFVVFCLNFIFKFIGNVYLAMQLPAGNNFLVVMGHLLSLVIIYLLTCFTRGNLFYVALAYTGSPLIIYLLSYPVTFFKIFPLLRPSLKTFDKKYLKSLFNVGMQFFFLQIAGVVLFGITNLMISHKFGPENVTPYNISYRLFSLIPMVMSIIISPMWSASTDAYARGDVAWIKRTMRTINKLMLLGSGVCLLMFACSKIIYHIWVGSEVIIPWSMSGLMAVFIIVFIWSSAYSQFLNGMGRLKIQTINTITVALLFYPVADVLGDCLGVNGFIISLILLNLSGLVLNVVQFNKVINHRDTGIWGK